MTDVLNLLRISYKPVYWEVMRTSGIARIRGKVKRSGIKEANPDRYPAIALHAQGSSPHRPGWLAGRQGAMRQAALDLEAQVCEGSKRAPLRM